MAQVLPLLVVVGIVAVLAVVYRRTNGVAAGTSVAFTPEALRELGAAPGDRTILVFTAPGCPPCGPAKAAAHDAGQRHGVAVAVADVTEHHDVAVAQHIYRAPTTIVVDERGRALARISGVPRPGALDAALAPSHELAA